MPANVVIGAILFYREPASTDTATHVCHNCTTIDVTQLRNDDNNNDNKSDDNSSNNNNNNCIAYAVAVVDNENHAIDNSSCDTDDNSDGGGGANDLNDDADDCDVHGRHTGLRVSCAKRVRCAADVRVQARCGRSALLVRAGHARLCVSRRPVAVRW